MSLVPTLKKIPPGAIDYDDPENRYARHRQKVINWLREKMDREEFKEWLIVFVYYDEEWANDIFEQASGLLRDAARQAPGGADTGGGADQRGHPQPGGAGICGRRDAAVAGSPERELQRRQLPPDPWDYRNLHFPLAGANARRDDE